MNVSGSWRRHWFCWDYGVADVVRGDDAEDITGEEEEMASIAMLMVVLEIIRPTMVGLVMDNGVAARVVDVYRTLFWRRVALNFVVAIVKMSTRRFSVLTTMDILSVAVMEERLCSDTTDYLDVSFVVLIVETICQEYFVTTISVT